MKWEMGVLMLFFIAIAAVIIVNRPSTAAPGEVTLENKKTGSSFWAFCESGNRVYVHIRGDETDMAVVPGGCR